MRHQSREIALQILFQTEFANTISTHDYLNLLEDKVDSQVVDYAETLVTGVKNNQADIDSKIKSHSSHWSIERMSVVDRNVLRMAIYEMFFASERLKPSIAINEAVDIAKKFGTTDSGSFVNGILDAISKKNL